MSTNHPSPRAAFVVLAGGSGTRLGAGRNKVYLDVGGRPVLAWSLDWAALVPAVVATVLVVRPGDEDAAAALLAAFPDVETTLGGATRQQSEAAALELLRARIESGAIDVVAIHDGARPLAGAALLARTVAVAHRDGGAVPTLPVDDVLPLGPDGALALPPEALHRVQTPQAFRARALLSTFDTAGPSGAAATDTAALFEAHSPDVVVRSVPGSADNLKVTYPSDVSRAERLLRPAPR